MPAHIAFLRAVNVGKRQVRMAALRQWLEEAGFTDVDTYIQTGNVRVGTPAGSATEVEVRLEALLRERCGFEVPCIMFSPAELRQVYADAMAIEPPPDQGEGRHRRYVVLFKQPPADEAVAQAEAYVGAHDRIWIRGRAAHVWVAGGFRDAEVFGRLAKVLAPGTNRDLKVVAALVDRWCG